jgi:DNA-binding beta-propeller fold protein YncE
MRLRLFVAALFFFPAAYTQTSPTVPIRVAGLAANSNAVGDGGPALQATLEYPVGVALDPAGNIYIADEGLLRIRKVTPAGLITTIAGTGDFASGADGAPAASSPVWPHAVAVDSRGTVYFSDSHTRVRKIAADGNAPSGNDRW